jgi:tRNA nucleotidyltransferase (CCA-adding enzyme)
MDREAATPTWSHFAHDADIGVRGHGPTIEAAFEQAALALSAVVTEHEIRPAERVVVHCEAPDRELLLVEWLNALVYEMAVRKMLFGRFRIRVSGTALDGEAFGEKVDVPRHQPAVEVKGATYTALEVGQDAAGNWHAQCVIDV